jgi:hypothetical protein
MGFVEETGAAQFYRDARILPIYEGTNGIQALDLAFRKTLRDGGEGVKAFIEEMKDTQSPDLGKYITALENATEEIIDAGKAQDLDLVGAMASPYLKGFALIVGGHLLAQSVRALGERDDEFAQEKRQTAIFYMHNILPAARAALHAATKGARSVS